MQPKFQEEMKVERMIKYWNRMVKKVPKVTKRKSRTAVWIVSIIIQIGHIVNVIT